MFKTSSRQLTLFLTVLTLSQSGMAHNSLIGSTPEAGSTVTSAPEILELEFSDPAWLNEVTVTDQAGNNVVEDYEEATTTLSIFSVPLSQEMKSGKYIVEWTVEGNDTHIITGEFSFTLEQEENASSASEDGSKQ